MNNTPVLSEDLLELEGIEYYRENVWDHYKYNNLHIPRVTHIIRQCRDSEGLINWAATVGKKRMENIRDYSCDVGSIVHEAIDNYLLNYIAGKNYNVNYSEMEPRYINGVKTALNNFKLWNDNLFKLGCPIQEIVGLEVPVFCDWYGGTVDGIVKINGAYYIIDFKTSKAISPEYLIQTAAYMWVINNGFVAGLPHINGIGIIRVDKSKYGKFNDLFLNEFIPEQNNMILDFQRCFLSYVEAYYRTASCDRQVQVYTNEYDINNVIKVKE